MSEEKKEFPKRKFPWLRFVIWLGIVITGTYIAITAQPGLTWFDIAWPVAVLFGVGYFISETRR